MYRLVSLLLFVSLLTGGWSRFLDCPSSGARCCTSVELPNGCECFDLSSPFTNTLFHRPQCPADIGVVFRLYNSRDAGTAIKVGQTSSYDSALPTRVVAHGFTDSGSAPWMLDMKDELLKQSPSNVILVDWQIAAKGPNYYQAAANTRMVGAMIARLCQYLHGLGTDYSNFHMIGHSLGSQIMGYAGKEIQRLEGRNLGRISGLDPAGPAFENYNEIVRVDASDADFVDIMHTDAEALIDAGFGMRYSVGTVDFYPNGGQHQPGCPAETFGLLSMINFEDSKDGGACSHGRAVDYFTNSINKCRYNPPTGGSACTMGFHVGHGCRGDHYPTTTATEPFC